MKNDEDCYGFVNFGCEIGRKKVGKYDDGGSGAPKRTYHTGTNNQENFSGSETSTE